MENLSPNSHSLLLDRTETMVQFGSIGSACEEVGNDSSGSVGVGGTGGHVNNIWDLFERVSLETMYMETQICVP